MGKIATYLIILLLIFFGTPTEAQELLVKSPLRFLALGDSYTIGQSVAVDERWPNQLAAALEDKGVMVEELKIIAQTGWRTDNLWSMVAGLDPDPSYNLVSLLIGVNNQYQGVDIELYPDEFRRLLDKAIDLCGGQKESVFVLSIPDYGYTPFGASAREQISLEIDQYNNINKQIAQDVGVVYFNITDISRQALEKPEYIATDNLHPSGEMYAKWVELILKSVRIDNSTSIEKEFPEESEMIVFPNPATRELNFRLPPDADKLEIINSRGKLIRQLEVSPGKSLQLDVSGWNSGIYFFRVTEQGISTASGKFILK
mgnify:CR=1 FL=1